MAEKQPSQWYWCLRHKRPEPAATACGAELRMGPYASQEAAQRYAETAQAREDAWAADDERWEGS